MADSTDKSILDIDLESLCKKLLEIKEEADVSEDFNHLARFKAYQLDRIKKTLKDVENSINEKMIELKGSFEDENFKIFIGNYITKKVPTSEAILQLFTYAKGNISELRDLLGSVLSSTSAFKAGEYKKLCDSTGLDNLTVKKERDKVEVQLINKEVLK